MDVSLELITQIIEAGVTGVFLFAGIIIIRMLMPILRDHLAQQREILDNMTETMESTSQQSSEVLESVVQVLQRLDIRMSIMERRLGYSNRFQASNEATGDPVVIGNDSHGTQTD